MDKFINKDCNSNIGLELLANHDKTLRIRNDMYSKKINKEYTLVVQEFKNFVISKLENYEPTKKRDEYDNYLRNMWIHYILGNKTREEYLDIFKYLGLIIDKESEESKSDIEDTKDKESENDINNDVE
uniref:Uncharacterized protein n=1 Tax=viral metagenome TaxID=1070528 RepID=A0A6C0JCD3_9ZZZZ